MSLERAEEARDALIHRLTNLVKAAKLEIAAKDALLAEQAQIIEDQAAEREELISALHAKEAEIAHLMEER